MQRSATVNDPYLSNLNFEHSPTLHLISAKSSMSGRITFHEKPEGKMVVNGDFRKDGKIFWLPPSYELYHPLFHGNPRIIPLISN